MKGIRALLGIGTAAAAAEYGIAAYFFRRTMIRQNAKTERTMDMSGTDWEQYMPKFKVWKAWMLTQPHEDVYIHSRDGLKLHGTYFPGQQGEGRKKIILAFHGYTSKGMSDYIGLSNYYLKRGYEMLLVDERAHGESEGTYIGFGCLDRLDAVRWIKYVEDKLGKDCEVWLHGTSMGGATVLMTGGLNLPECVKGVISDCAFTNAWDVFAHVLKSMYHLPAFPILNIADQMISARAGYRLKECDSSEEIKKIKIPLLLIHGDADTFVPCWMGKKIYDACTGPKDILIVKGAGHCESYYKDQAAYEEKLTAFLEERGNK